MDGSCHSENSAWIEIHSQTDELPQCVNILFADSHNDYQQGHQCAKQSAITYIIDLTNKTEYPLTTVEARHAILIFKGMLTAPATITVPTKFANKKFIVAHHCSGDFPLYF